MLDEARAVGAEFNRIAGENCLYFETGQGSALSAGANFGADQVTMEARNYGLARHYDPFLVNTVVGFIGPEYSITTGKSFAPDWKTTLWAS